MVYVHVMFNSDLKRLPWVKRYGDVSAISGADLPPVDKVDGNGCASERELCFIDINGWPHSAGYLNPFNMCEIDKVDNALMSDLVADTRRIVQDCLGG